MGTRWTPRTKVLLGVVLVAVALLVLSDPLAHLMTGNESGVGTRTSATGATSAPAGRRAVDQTTSANGIFAVVVLVTAGVIAVPLVLSYRRKSGRRDQVSEPDAGG